MEQIKKKLKAKQAIKEAYKQIKKYFIPLALHNKSRTKIEQNPYSFLLKKEVNVSTN